MDERTKADVTTIAKKAWEAKGPATCAYWLWCAADWHEEAAREATANKTAWLKQIAILAEQEGYGGYDTIYGELNLLLTGVYDSDDLEDDPWSEGRLPQVWVKNQAKEAFGQAIAKCEKAGLRLCWESGAPYLMDVEED